MTRKMDFYTIGDISDVTGLTKAMPMYYEKKEIVVPALRDNENNYRYYNAQQLEELLLLKELKKVGFSLEQIKIIIHNRNLVYLKSELEKKMQMHNEAIVNALKDIRHYTELYYRVLDALSIKTHGNQNFEDVKEDNLPLSFCSFPSRPIVSILYNGIFNQRKAHMEKVAFLYKIVQQYALHTDGPIYVIFHDSIETSYSNVPGQVEVFIPLSHYDNKCPYVRIIPESQFIVATVRGDYDLLKDKYDQIFKSAETLNIKTEKTSMEEYIVGPTMTSNPEEYITKIHLPVINNKLR